jgi:phosphoribosylformimino-5-aminoimidazole carboxamide ribotide isomerase
MLIPSVDLMDGKIVQLVQGKTKALEFDNFDQWIERFSPYPLIQLIDLDAAMGKGSNPALVRRFASRLPCQVGGGVRSLETAQARLADGAQRVIIGSALFFDGKLDRDFAERIAGTLGASRLVFAADSRAGRVVIQGWKKPTDVTTLEMIRMLEPWCGAFLYTHVESEGLLQGFPQEVIRPLRQVTKKQLIAAGGIRVQREIDELHALGVDAVVGMAIYRGLLSP